MTRKSSKQLKFVAFIMSLVMLMTVAPFSAFAEDGVIDTSEAIDQTVLDDEIISDVEPAAVENTAVLTAADVPEFIAMSDLTTRGTIRRVYEEEADLSTILFENNDGTRTLYMYGVPVKYVAPDGTTRDKSTAISSLSGLQALWNGTTLTQGQMTTLAQNASIGRLELGQAAEALSLMNTRLMAAYGSTLRLSDMAYASLDSDIRSLYPTAVSDGVVLNYGDYSIRTIPVATGSLVLPGAANVAESSSLTDNDIRTRVRYSNAFGLGTILQYTPTTMGVKEEIILTSNVGKNSFSFRIETGGLTIQEENGNYFFFDPATQRVIAQLGEIIAYDSNGQIARGAVTVQSVIAGQRYNVTISVSPEFLANAAYPVSVDPTTTIYESNYYGDLIEDNAVYSGAGAWGYTFDSFHYVGAVSSTPANESYAGQALYRFPGLYNANLFTDYCNLPSASINSFVLHLKTGQVDSGTTLYVNSYIPVWQSSPRICDASYYNYLDTSRYNIPIYNVPNAGNVSVNITDIAREWADVYYGASDYTMASWPSGIVIRNADPTKVCILTAIEQSSEVYATLDYSHDGGTYYLNSAATRSFLGGANGSSGDALFLESGLMNNIGSDVAWTFQYVGNSQFYIQPTSNPTLYISSTGELTDTAFAWTVTSVVGGGGVNIYRTNAAGTKYYLGVNSLGNIVVSSTLAEDQIKWRKILTNLYVEFESNFESTLSVEVGNSIDLPISTISGNASFSQIRDFTYQTTGYAQYSNSGEIWGLAEGTETLKMTHIPTGVVIYIAIDVCAPIVILPCIVNRTVDLSSYIQEYQSILTNVTWYNNSSDIISVNSFNVVTGLVEGLAEYTAVDNMGNPVLHCFIYVVDIMADFTSGQVDYLLLNGTYLGTMSSQYIELYNLNIDPLLLRVEWFIYIVNALEEDKTDEEICQGLNNKYNLSLDAQSQIFQILLADVQAGRVGGYSRERLLMLWNESCFVLDFMWFNFASYSLATIDVVNCYTSVSVTTNSVATHVESAKQNAMTSYYPPNDGFVGTPTNITLSPNTIIQRTGGYGGAFAAPQGTPLPNLSLPYYQRNSATTYLKVLKPIEVLSGTAAAWFGCPGGGTQYKFYKTIQELIDSGFLEVYN